MMRVHWLDSARAGTRHLREESGGQVGLERGLVRAVGRTRNAVGQGELDLGAQELLHVVRRGSRGRGVTLGGTHTRRHDLGVTDLDAGEASAVATSHVHVCRRGVCVSDAKCKAKRKKRNENKNERTHVLDGIVQGDVAELLVHVVGATAAVVAQSDAVVVHDAAVALADLQTWHICV